MSTKSWIVSLCLLISGSIFAHGGEESRVSIEPQSEAEIVAGNVPYTFQLFDTANNKPLRAGDLVETHTMILHLIVYDAALQEFNHVHPVNVGVNWTTELKLPRNGTYFVWAQGKLTDGTEFSTYRKAVVKGGTSENPVKPLGDHRKGSDRNTVVELSKAPIKAGQASMLTFTVTRDDGKPPLMTPYLGALAHLIAVSPDGDELIHVHPMAGSKPNTGMIHATFPSAGDYRVWIQFIDRDVVKTIPVSISVVK